MRVRLTQVVTAHGNRGWFVADGVCETLPEPGKPFRVTRDDGQTTSTTDVRDVAVDYSAAGMAIEFHTIAGHRWRIEQLPEAHPAERRADLA